MDSYNNGILDEKSTFVFALSRDRGLKFRNKCDNPLGE